MTLNVVHARQWYIEPNLEISVGYDENPTLVEDSTADSEAEVLSSSEISPQSDITFGEVGGELLMVSESPSDSISALFGLSAAQYSESEYDTESAQIQLDYQRGGERTDSGVGLAYRRDSSFETELVETGISPIGTEQTELSISPEITRRFSQRLRGTVGYEYSDVEFSGGSMSFVDYTEQSLFGEIERSVTERLSLSFSAELSQYRPAQDDDDSDALEEDVTRLRVGLTHRVNEVLDWSISAGPTFTDSNDPSPEPGSSESGPAESEDADFSFRLDYAGFRSNTSAQYTKGQQVSALGGNTDTDGLSVMWNREQTFGGTLSVELSFSRLEGSRVFDRVDTLTFSPQFDLPLNSRDSLSFQYTHIDQETVSSGDVMMREVSNNRFVLSWVRRFRRISIRN